MCVCVCVCRHPSLFPVRYATRYTLAVSPDLIQRRHQSYTQPFRNIRRRTYTARILQEGNCIPPAATTAASSSHARSAYREHFPVSKASPCVRRPCVSECYRGTTSRVFPCKAHI